MDTEEEALARLVAKAVAETILARKPSMWEAARKALVNVSLSGLGAAVLIIIGFWLNGIQAAADKSKEDAKEALAISRRTEEVASAITVMRAQLAAREASLSVMRDSIAKLEAELKTSRMAPAAPVSAAELEKTRESLRAREDKELYRIQQQQSMVPDFAK